MDPNEAMNFYVWASALREQVRIITKQPPPFEFQSMEALFRAGVTPAAAAQQLIEKARKRVPIRGESGYRRAG